MSPVVVGARVDWLDIDFRVWLSDRAKELLESRGAATLRADAPCSIELAGQPFEMFRIHREGKWLLRNVPTGARVTIMTQAPGRPNHETELGDDEPGWTVHVEASGTGLLARGWRAAIEDAHAWAGALGLIRQARIGRRDLCCDVAGYTLDPSDHQNFIRAKRLSSREVYADGKAKTKKTKRRTTKGELTTEEKVSWFADGWRIEGDAEGLMSCWVGETFTGFTFGRRGTVAARIYDKMLQLRTPPPGRVGVPSDRREAEFAWWKSNGWDEVTPVVRVEFELRGEALDELDLRCSLYGDEATRGIPDPKAHAKLFEATLDETWAYCSKKWLRLTRRVDGRPTSPKWRTVQEATFVAAAEPRARRRKRSEPRAGQSIGATRSLVGASGELPQNWPARVCDVTGVVLDEERTNVDEVQLVNEAFGHIKTEEGRQAAALLRARLDFNAIYRRGGKLAWQYLLDRNGGTGTQVCAAVWQGIRATRARFADWQTDIASPGAGAA